MPGRTSQSKALQYLGLAVAIIAVIGTVALDWEWGRTDDVLPFAIAIVAVIIAVVVTIYSRTS